MNSALLVITFHPSRTLEQIEKRIARLMGHGWQHPHATLGPANCFTLAMSRRIP